MTNKKYNKNKKYKLTKKYKRTKKKNTVKKQSANKKRCCTYKNKYSNKYNNKQYKGGKLKPKDSIEVMKQHKTTNARRNRINELKKKYNTYHNLHKSVHFIDEPQLEDFEIPIETMEQSKIEPISKRILTDTLNNSSYSLLSYYFRDHPPDFHNHDNTIEKYNNGNCVALAYHVQEKLREQGIHSEIIPGSLPTRLIQPGYPILGHAVAVVSTPTHFILHEPAHFLSEPIIVSKNGEKVTAFVSVFDETYYYKYSPKDKKIFVSLDDGSERYYYDLRKVKNISQSISYPINTKNRRPPIVVFDPFKNKKKAHLSIRLDKGVLQGYNIDYKDNPADDGWYDELQWREILNNNELSEEEKYRTLCEWKGLSDEQCKIFGYGNPDELREMILAIIESNNEKEQM
jgi:hypothetical protein